MADLTEEEIRDLKDEILERLNSEKMLMHFKNFIEDKDITIFLGNTRSGKSTLINLLLGNRLRSVKRKELPRQFRLELSNKDDGPRIGYGSLSVTDFPSIYNTSDDKVLMDSPGFEDNRGIPQDIFNAICVNQIRFANSIKFVLVCYIHDLVNDNVRSFTNLLSQMTHLVTNIENIQNSVCIVFTKDRDNYSPEELRTMMRGNILNQNGLNMDRRLLRNLTADEEFVGVFKMPTREGDVNLNELEVNIHHAIDHCEQVALDELNIRFALSDQTNLFLRAVYPEYTDTQYFESEINRTVQEYNNYFDIDLYVFASYKEELDEVTVQLDLLNDNLIIERNITSINELKRSLETLLDARHLRLSDEFQRSLQFILALDNALLFEENCRETVIQNYNNSMNELLNKVTRLRTKIENEVETRRRNNVLLIYQGTAFGAGIGPASVGILNFIQGIVPRGIAIPGATGFTSLEAGVGTIAATSACVIGGIAVGAGAGAAYMLIKEHILRRRQARVDQNR